MDNKKISEMTTRDLGEIFAAGMKPLAISIALVGIVFACAWAYVSTHAKKTETTLPIPGFGDSTIKTENSLMQIKTEISELKREVKEMNSKQ